MKKIIIPIFIIIILGGVYLLVFNPKTTIVENNTACYQGCKDAGFNRGMCLRGGSGTGSGCAEENGTQLHSIIDRDAPIPGCDFISIGSWDECCCF